MKIHWIKKILYLKKNITTDIAIIVHLLKTRNSVSHDFGKMIRALWSDEFWGQYVAHIMYTMLPSGIK